VSSPKLRGSRLRILVGGYLGLLPAGGVTWDYVQYPIGLAALGHDVYYVEDTAMWPIFQAGGDGDCSANVSHLCAVMSAFGLGDRWAYRDIVHDQWHGPCTSSIKELVQTADVFIDVSHSTHLREFYQLIPVRVMIDSDPMFTQIQNDTYNSCTPGQTNAAATAKWYTHHFTFGESVGSPECRIPLDSLKWRATRQPICLDLWSTGGLPPAPGAMLTTVMNWSARQPLIYDGETWGQKDLELMRLLHLPQHVRGVRLGLAVGQTTSTRFPTRLFQQNGWAILDPDECAPTWTEYRDFIRNSLGEFSVAKETYVKARTGWFSCRSACYLAAGRPVATQETDWSKHIPSGSGLFAFDDLESAAAAIEAIASDPERQGREARAIAEAYFDSRKVLSKLLADL
jgi:hypothetical protein